MTNAVTKTSEGAVPARPAATPRPARIYRPLTDIVETETGVMLIAEMPGVGVDDVEISLDRRVLSIRGRAKLTDPEGYRLSYREYGEGDYERVFTISEDLDPAKISARMRHGVLWVTLPRAEAAQPKRIAVTAG